ncbi:hypothetical protein [Ruminococcus sp.]|uniref:hypothetical protein n=1 Tax=Ruminococcus sp. TaxID=41978 RepID=UPI00388D0F2F
MEKTIKIGKKSVRLNNNVSWAIVYRDQFGRDIIPTIMPLFASALDIISGIINETGKTDNIELTDLAKLADGDSLINAAIHLGGFEFTDLICITWALAKCADEDIPEPREWISQFDNFPVDVVAPEVFSLIFKGVVSSKNLKRLEDLKKRIQPTSISTQSSSPDSNED